jgi:[protein-PII] uridylyltransferase
MEVDIQDTIKNRLIEFNELHPDPDQAGTVLQLRCNDQPGLLSRVAAAIYEQGVQVHNARIATFGERVEDTFLISDAKHEPLTSEAEETLAESIREHLEQG